MVSDVYGRRMSSVRSRSSFLGWYVNLEAPIRRNTIGIDTTDHALDLEIDPQRQVSRKRSGNRAQSCKETTISKGLDMVWVSDHPTLVPEEVGVPGARHGTLSSGDGLTG